MCGKLEAIWIAYVDGKATARERALVDAHVSECAECARRRHEFLAVSRVLGEWAAPEPSPWFDARLRRKIAEDARRVSWLPRFSELFPPIPVGIGALVVLACLLMFSGNHGALFQTAPPQTLAVDRDPRMVDVLHAADEVDLLSNLDLLSELKKPELPQGERR